MLSLLWVLMCFLTSPGSMKVFWQTCPEVRRWLDVDDKKIQFYRAYVVPLSRVGGRVSLQVGLLHECLSTVGAHKLLFALVIPKMVLKIQQFWPQSSICLSRRSPGKQSGIWTSCRIEYNCSAFLQCAELCGIQDLPSWWIPFHRKCTGMSPSPPYVCSPAYHQMCWSNCNSTIYLPCGFSVLKPWNRWHRKHHTENLWLLIWMDVEVILKLHPMPWVCSNFSWEDCCRSLFLKYIFGNGCCKDKTSHHVVLGPRVLSQVQVQATLPFQPLATDVAHKILLHRVLDHVLL